MHPSRSRTGVSEALPGRTTPATPKVARSAKGPSRSDSSTSSPLHASRLSIDKSPTSVDSKPAADRRSPRISTAPDRQQRLLKGSELQAQLGAVQEDLNKAKERLASKELERASIQEELKEAKRLVDETNEKLSEAIIAQKRAEENCEIEKFRADELEQTCIEIAQQREEKWQKEIESLQCQHAVDVAALLSVNQERERVMHELAVTVDAKETALKNADDAVKIAEINANKVDVLSGELDRVKALLSSELEAKSCAASDLIKKLNMEIVSLKEELGMARAATEKVGNMEGTIENLKVELDEVKKAKSAANNLLDEWKRKAEELDLQIDEANCSKKSISEALASTVQELETNNRLLCEKEVEISNLRADIETLTSSAGKHEEEVKESAQLLQSARQESLEINKALVVLRSELEQIREERMQALDHEMAAASRAQILLEEKRKLISDLEVSREDEDKSKKAMETFASALHEVSVEARESKEKLLITQDELQNAERQIENLNRVLKATEAKEEKYQTTINDVKTEIDALKKLLEISHMETRNLNAELAKKKNELEAALKESERNFATKREMDRLLEATKMMWELKESSFVNFVRDVNTEISTISCEVDRLSNFLQQSKTEEQAIQDDWAQLVNSLKQLEFEACSARAESETALADVLKLKENLLDKENELQSVLQENKELSKLLEVTTTKQVLENGVRCSSDNTELVKRNVDVQEEEKSLGFSFPQVVEKNERGLLAGTMELTNENGYAKLEEGSAMVESDKCVSHEKALPLEPDRGPDSVDDELDSKNDGDSFDRVNGFSSELQENGELSLKKHQQKKKKALLPRFGSLLKRKNSTK